MYLGMMPRHDCLEGIACHVPDHETPYPPYREIARTLAPDHPGHNGPVMAQSPIATHTSHREPPAASVEPVTWRLHREVVLLAGWGRAILLQLAHPLVAQGVADHSGFADSAWGRVTRLRRTLGAMLALTFGTPEEAAAAASVINRIHDRVNGQLAGAAGGLAAGSRYSAHDPALLTSVHATLVDTFLITYERFVAPLTAAERDRYCREAGAAAPLLGIPDDTLPRTVDTLTAYMERMFASDQIVVTDTARRLAREVLSLGLPRMARPLVAAARLPAVRLLPRAIREGLGLRWTRWPDRALTIMAAGRRTALPLLPTRLRAWPAARRATRRAGAARSRRA